MNRCTLISIVLISGFAGNALAQQAPASNRDVKSLFSSEVSVRSIVGEVDLEKAEKRKEFTVQNRKSKDTFAIRAVSKKMREIKQQARPTKNLGDPIASSKDKDADITKSEIAQRIAGVKDTEEVADALGTIEATSQAVLQSTQNLGGSLQSPEVLDKAIKAVDRAVENVEMQEKKKSTLNIQRDYTF